MNEAEMKAMLLKKVEEMLADPTFTWEMRRGTRETTGPFDDTRSYEMTDGITITLEVHGGARDEHKSPEQFAQESMRAFRDGNLPRR